MKFAAARLAALAGGFAVVFGCGHGDAGGERRLTQLHDELARVQADRDRVDQRLVALETRPAATSPDAAAAERTVGKTEIKPQPQPQPHLEKAFRTSIETPKLRVIRLGVSGAPEPSPAEVDSAETASSIDDDGTARATIRVTGHGSSGRVRGRAGDRSAKADVIEETIPPEEPALSPATGTGGAPIRERVPRPSALDPDARRAYDDAYALVQAKKCQQALEAFAGFIVRWPDHPNADNALYWRGECYAQLGDLPRAIEQFEGTIARFPLGNKVPDALLKLGISNTKLGNDVRAKEAFERLDREYPRSEARRRIPQGAANKP